MLALPDFPIRQRDFLLEISRAITARLELSEVLRRVLHASLVMIAAKAGIVALRDDHENLYVRAFTGIQKEVVPQINQKLYELVAGAEGVGWNHEYLNEKLAEISQAIDPELAQSVAMPLVFAGKPLGLLIVFRSYKSQINNNDVTILQSFADQASIAVHNAQLYENIAQEQQRLSAILQYSGDGVMILDASLNILQVNQAFEQITGWSTENAVGLNQDDVIIWNKIEQNDLRDAITDGTFPMRKQAASQARSTFYVQGEIERQDGMLVSIGITYSPLFSDDGNVNNIIANIRDITHFRRVQEMQNVFISTVSHELRTPVALIKGYASTLSRNDVEWDMDVVRDSLNVIEEEADRLTDLIDDLLTASKIQVEENLSLTLTDVQLDQLAQNAVSRMATQTSNHHFELSFPEHFPAAIADARRIRQVIDNLITNAIKYSPSGGTITVGGRYSEQYITFFIRDEGSGIPEHALPHIFERFYRVENHLKTKTKGTGLGLYLVKAIIDAHDGELHVKSQLGKGSTFYFTLPRDGRYSQ
jgi:PAS domain S-box-containing protein